MLSSYLQKMRLFSRNVRLSLVVMALYGFCFIGIYLVLANLYVLRLGFGPEYVGLLWSIWGLVSAVACLPAGVVAGSLGLRPTMIIGILIGLVGFAGVPVADFLPRAMHGGWIIVMSSLTGLSYALVSTSIGPFIMRSTTTEERDHAFAVYFSLVPLGAFVGSLAAGLLPGLFASLLNVSIDSPAPYRYPLLLGALLYSGAAAALAAAQEIGPSEEVEAVSDRGHAPIVLLAVVAVTLLLQAAAGSAANTFFNVYMDTDLRASTALIGGLASIGQLLSVPAPLVVPGLMARWDTRRVVAGAALGTALSALPLALIPHWAAAGLGFIGATAFTMMFYCVVFPYSLTLVPARWQAAMSGAGTLSVGLNSSMVAFAGGYIATALGFPSLFLIGAGLTAAGVALFWLTFRGPRGEPVQS